MCDKREWRACEHEQGSMKPSGLRPASVMPVCSLSVLYTRARARVSPVPSQYRGTRHNRPLGLVLGSHLSCPSLYKYIRVFASSR
jgi:hypothetical protein